MKTIYFPATDLLPLHSKSNSSKYCILSFVLVMLAGMLTSVNGQIIPQITINKGSNLILNGNVSLVVNNAAFQNNGTFVAGNGTVDFSGNNDTVLSHVSGYSVTTFNNLSVSKSAYGIALKSAVVVKNVLKINSGNLYTDSNLTLGSDANLTARVAVVPSGSNIIGKVNVERYLTSKRAWRLMTAPVTSSNTIFNSWQNKGIYVSGSGTLVTGPNASAAGNGLDLSATNTVSMKGWDYNNQKFANVLNTKTAISAGNNGRADNTGYFIFIRGDRDPANANNGKFNSTTLTSTGALQTGTQTFIASSGYNKYTLIGNPYASPVDFNSLTKSNLVKRFYVWDASLNKLGGYVMLDDVGNNGIYVNNVKGSTQTKEIQSGQAFFVLTNSNGTASITFNEASKSGVNNNSMFRPLTPGTTAGIGTGQIITTLSLLDSGNNTILADGAIAQFDNIFSAEVDLDDAAKFSNTNENISILRNNFALAAERRPAAGINDTVYFKLNNTTQRNYQFVFEVTGLEQPGMMGFLEDSWLGTSTVISLSGSTTVNFTINGEAASAAVTRFKIVFKQATAILPVIFSSVKAYQKTNNIAVEWKVENELNMVKYDVEKSTDGTSFTKVNTVNVAGGNNVYNTYSWLDVNAVQGNNLYRIKSYDRSGEVKFSSIVKVTMGKSNNTGSFSIYPNPVTGNVINLRMNNQPAGKYQVKLININGQSIFVKSVQSNGGNSTESLIAGSKLLPGVYQLEITGQDNSRNMLKAIVEY
ncbi:MAG: T9SS type A sorting domain-containing protein [Ferruginibacter sp.]